jgi:hypothetical protein
LEKSWVHFAEVWRREGRLEDDGEVGEARLEVGGDVLRLEVFESGGCLIGCEKALVEMGVVGENFWKF